MLLILFTRSCSVVGLYFSAMEVSECCAICTYPVDSSVSTLGEKGSPVINQASKLRKDCIHTVPGEEVHQDCCRNYYKPDQIAKDTKHEQSKPSTSSDGLVLRSSEEGFSFATDCFFCGRPAKLGRERKKYDILQVKIIGLKDTHLAICSERADSWSDTVKAHILHVHDLHAADAVYLVVSIFVQESKSQLLISRQALKTL